MKKLLSSTHFINTDENVVENSQAAPSPHHLELEKKKTKFPFYSSCKPRFLTTSPKLGLLVAVAVS